MTVYYTFRPDGETAFTVNPSSLKFGAGALRELGADARGLGMKRVAFFADPIVLETEPGQAARRSLAEAGLDIAEFTAARVEPTDASFTEAAAFARDAGVDGYVSLGGGSVIDTAKVANLLAAHPDELMAYVNAPLGAAKAVPGPLRPHIACPTTSGTGSETTGVAVFDLVEQQLKTGISSKFLKPTLGIVDPTTTHSLPGGVVAATGFDVLTHAIESYTACPFTSRVAPTNPNARPPYQGANPYSDIGALEAIRLGGRYLVRAVRDAEDTEARHALMFAASLAGMAFGNAGVHIPHAMSYSVAGMNHRFTAQGYEKDSPMVPHGISVVLNAPAAFRFTGPVAPQRHAEAARALAGSGGEAGANNPGEALAAALIAMMRETDLPNGLSALGYGSDDIPALVDGAFAQQRLLVLAPRPVGKDDLAALYRDAMRYW